MHGIRVAALILLAGTTTVAQAQPLIIADSGDNGWMLAASLLVLATTMARVSMPEDRAPANRIDLALFGSTAVALLVFAAVGYSLAFSEGTALLGGVDHILLAGIADVQAEMTISGSTYVLFEAVVVVLVVSILVASVVRQCRAGWAIAFAGVWSLIVYVPVAHWLWGGGWLVELGSLDYAGGIVVQLTAGVSALVIGLLIGRDDVRNPVADSDGFAPQAALISVGLLALLGASGFAATTGAADAIINGLLAASAAALMGLVLARLRESPTLVADAAASMVAGLAAVSTGADVIGPTGAILIGLVGAIGAGLAGAVLRALQVGSAADAFIAHGGGAIAGAILFPVLVLPIFGGPGFGDGVTVIVQMTAQAVAVVAVALWAATGTAIAALTVAMVLSMRQAKPEN